MLRTLAALLVMGWLVFAPAPARADWKAEVGFTALRQRISNLPDGSSLNLLQVEAGFLETDHYMPDTALAQFDGIAITDITGVGQPSWHATNVAAYFYGRTASMLPNVQTAGVYRSTEYLQNSLKYLTASLTPGYVGQYDVINHSWIQTGGSSTLATAAAKLDYQVRYSKVVVVAGLNNVELSNGTWTGFDVPKVFGQSYNAITVGVSSGYSSHGPSPLGTAKPDLVAPMDKTSWAAAAVSSAAGLLRANADARGTSDLSDPRLIKAQLMAGATKLGERPDVVVSWDGTTATIPAWQKGAAGSADDASVPLDYYQGAGQLNIENAWDIIAAGAQPVGGVGLPTGWALRSVAAGGADRYFFDVHSPAESFSALLSWYGDARRIGQSWTVDVDNLDLRLYAVEPESLALGGLLQASLSSVDNVEHLWLTGLAPGRYALEVAGAGREVEYALAWQSLGALLAGDAANDGVVDDRDLNVILGHWGAGPSAVWSDGDLNADGLVDDRDLSVLLGHWGDSAAAEAALARAAVIPEPASLALAAAGLLGLRRRR